MTDDERREVSSITPTGGPQALAKRASSLAARGLKTLHSWDSARIIDAVKAISAARFEDEVVKILRTKIPELIQLDAWSLLLTECDTTQEKPLIEGETENRELRFEIVAGEEVCLSKDEGVRNLATKRFTLETSIAGWVAQKRETVLLSDARKDSRFALEVDGRALDNTTSLLASPLRFQNECLGVIELVNREGSRAFSEADAGTLETLADFAAIAIAGSRHVMKIHELTITDEKTGLYNARHLSFMLDTELHRSNRYNYEFSLVGLDLVGLKALSYLLSYVKYNHLLAEIGNQLRAAGRLIDFAFRYGEEEFMILLPQMAADRASALARRVPQLMEQPFRATSITELQPPSQVAGPKCAVAFVTYPADGLNRKELIAMLDHRLHRAKVGHE